MNLALLYPWVKAAHVAAALLFFGGVMAMSCFLWSAPRDADETRALAAALHRWDGMVTTPAMLLLWACGFWMAASGHWFGAVWLNIKFFLVVVLSAVHGMQSARLRGMRQGRSAGARPAMAMIVICAAGIALLAVVKPA